jgi:hypothetical protein
VKHTVIREQPVQPPVEKIILEVTPAELAEITYAIGMRPGTTDITRLYAELSQANREAKA